MSDRAPSDVLANFLDAEGRLHTIPSKHGKLLVVLDFLAQRFEPGVRYPEPRVNEILGEVHPDFAALRRYLVEEGFLDRADGDNSWVYWRTGGTFDV